MRTGSYKKCLNCGKQIYVSKSKINRTKYCSKKCSFDHRNYTVQCDTCGAIFIKRKSVVFKHNFCSNNCKRNWVKTLTGSKHNCWKGGKRTDSRGYIYIHTTDHPNRLKCNYYAEHRCVCEKILGRLLKRKEAVHHINENKSDNRPENLYLFSTNGEHVRYHNIIKNNKDKIITKSNLMEWMK